MSAPDPEEAAAGGAEELSEFRALLATMPLPALRRPEPPEPRLPFDPLPPLEAAVRRAIEGAALESNQRYLETFIEAHSFCPFSRGGRAQGKTARLVHYADHEGFAPLLDLLVHVASDPDKQVVQVILPLVAVTAEAFSRFCHELTAYGNARLARAREDGADVLAVAPLHPELPYSTQNPYALIPLFRRAPDPTIQWVRLDALEALYRNRSGETIYVEPSETASFVAQPKRAPLFDRIAETNMKMAQRLGIAEVERTLRSLASAGQARYADILLRDEPPPPAAGARPACPHARAVDRAAATPALFLRGNRWAIARLLDLPLRVPRRFTAGGVELVAVRVGDEVHVLHGRCPHRFAPMSDAIVEEDRLVCPHHGWDFRLDTGISEGVPDASIARFHAEVREGLVFVDAAELRAFRERYVQAFSEDDDVV